MRSPRSLDRQIFALAVPTFATLVSEPLLLLADSAIVGHLGTDQLAGLSIATSVLGVVIGLCIFLAYGTTGTVARRLGAGDRAGALSGGIDGMVLAVTLGAVLAVVLELTLPWIVGLFGAPPGPSAAALAYLRIAVIGLPAVLLLLASIGVLRGVQDTRTPLVVAVSMNLANIGLNVALVYGVGLGIAGSALGTLIAQCVGAAVLAAVVVRSVRREEVQLRFRPRSVLAAARTGSWLVLRTGALQAGILFTTIVAASFGSVALAAHQVVVAIWSLLAFALDAIAIAGQAIIGRVLGGGDVALGRAMTRRMIGWGTLFGAVFALMLVLLRPLYIGVFTPDPAVQRLISQVLWVVAVATPLAGIVFVLDGVLIGAGDVRYLAFASVVALAAYLPMAVAVDLRHAGLVWLWVAYAGYVSARLATLVVRARGDRWARTGASV